MLEEFEVTTNIRVIRLETFEMGHMRTVTSSH